MDQQMKTVSQMQAEWWQRYQIARAQISQVEKGQKGAKSHD
jgi:hypothetical protein